MNDTNDAAAIFAPLWRRKWLILAVGILVAGATYAYYRRKPTVYSAAAQVYLGAASEVQALLNTTQGKTNLSERAISDQATLINSNVIGEAVRQRLVKEHKRVAAHGSARAKPVKGSDYLTITAQARTKRAAAQLANDYARAYIRRQSVNHRHQVLAAIASARRQRRLIESGPAPSSTQVNPKASEKGSEKTTPSSTTPSTSGAGLLSAGAVIRAANISEKISQLEADLSVAGVQQTSTAVPQGAVLLSPKPRKNAIFGFVLGIVVAAIAAYAFSRFDRRLRTLSDIESVFQTQIITALPATRRPIIRRDGRPAPARSLLEPLRRLHTTLQLGEILDHDREISPRSILFVSPDPGDGKSTVVANLALVQRDAGERVAVIEADLRRPVQARLLGVEGAYGLADVLAGKVEVDEAMRSAMSPTTAHSDPEATGAGLATVVRARGQGSLSVLLSGGTVTNPPALLASREMSALLRSIAEDFDYTLVDAPPPLAVSDVMSLLQVVHAIVIVARIGHTRWVSAERLAQLLIRTSSTQLLGVVAVQVSPSDVARYGFSDPSKRGWRELFGR
jgi:succinoglycan biosynthesis transport protein ExoP